MMIAAGYLLKRTAIPEGYKNLPIVKDIASVSACVNADIVDLMAAWQYNEYGLANAPDVLDFLVETQSVDASDATLFYYEAYELGVRSNGQRFCHNEWTPLDLKSSAIQTAVVPPAAGSLTHLGYDVVIFGDYPEYSGFVEHSPLSCNMAAEGLTNGLTVNSHCLFDSFEQAKSAIDQDMFIDCEAGLYTIFSVARVQR